MLSPGKILNANPNINSLKRKRREVAGRGHRPPLKTPALRPLVDYGEDEDEDAAESKQMQQGDVRVTDNTTTGSSPKLAPSPIPNTAGLAGGPPRRVPKEEEEDDEDAMLEALVRGRTPTPGPRPESPVPTLSPPPSRLGEKRRRVDGDDDDDELLSRLTKPKKQQMATTPMQHQQQQNKMSIAVDSLGVGNRQKNGDDPPKKIKVKIGGFGGALAAGSAGTQTLNLPGSATNAPVVSENNTAPSITVSSPSPSRSPAPSPSPSPAPSDSGTKDGDTG